MWLGIFIAMTTVSPFLIRIFTDRVIYGDWLESRIPILQKSCGTVTTLVFRTKTFESETNAD